MSRRIGVMVLAAGLLLIPATALAAGHGSGKALKVSVHAFLPAKHAAARTHTKSSPVSFTITKFRIETYGSAPDWHLQNPALATATAGSKIFVSSYVNVASAPPNAVATTQVTVHLGTASGHGGSNFQLGSNSVGLWRLASGWILGGAGTYSFTVSISINGSPAQTASTTLSVK